MYVVLKEFIQESLVHPLGLMAKTGPEPVIVQLRVSSSDQCITKALYFLLYMDKQLPFKTFVPAVQERGLNIGSFKIDNISL